MNQTPPTGPTPANSPIVVEKPVANIWMSAGFALAIIIGAFALSGVQSCVEDVIEAADVGAQKLDPLTEVEIKTTVSRAEIWKVCDGTGVSTASWMCHAEDPTKLIYRGGPAVATTDGIPYCSTAASCPAGSIAAGDSATAYLTTAVDAGVDVRCVCGTQQ